GRVQARAAGLEDLGAERWATEGELLALAERMREGLTAQHAAADQSQALAGRIEDLAADHGAVARRVEEIAVLNYDALRAVEADTQELRSAGADARGRVE